jgi:ribosomal protein L7/L12
MRPRDLSTDLRQRLAHGATLDDALAAMRSDGASIVECIVSVRTLRQCDLVEAKRVVEASPAWADVKARNDDFHKELERLANDDA